MSAPTLPGGAPATTAPAHAGDAEQEPEDGSGVVLAAVGLLAVLLGVLTLQPLIQGWSWYPVLAVVILAIVGTGSALRMVSPWPAAAVPVQVLAALVAITAMFARDVALLGLLPGPDALKVLGKLLNDGLATAAGVDPPVPAARGVVLLACYVTAIVTLAVDLVAAGLRRPAAAGLPLLALYCVPAAVLPGGLKWWHFAAGAAGYLLLVGLGTGSQVMHWGRVVEADGGQARGTGPLSGGRRVAVVAVAVAALVPALLPGSGDTLFPSDGRRTNNGTGGNITVINPILTVQQDLTARSDAVVVRYRSTSTAREPLRIVSDDVFDGDHWSPSVGSIPRSNTVQKGLPRAPGLAEGLFTTTSTTQVRVLDLKQTYLPLPYPPLKVDIAGAWLYDARTLNVVGDHVDTRNTSYTATSLEVTPDPDQLDTAPAAPAAAVDAYGRAPTSMPGIISDTATRIAGTGTAYQQAMRIQQWLRESGGFTYSATVARPGGHGDGGYDALVAFLRTKRGYCVQFASTMAVMARSLGIPARVGVGFLPGENAADGWAQISVRDAHAWPELYFSGIGWVRFEPTPGVRSGAAPSWTTRSAGRHPGNTVTKTVTPTAESTQIASATRTTAAASTTTATSDATTAKQPTVRRVLAAVPWRLVGGVLLLLLLAAVPLGLDRASRRIRWNRAQRAGPAERAEIAWSELRTRLADLGVGWNTSWTPRATTCRLADDHRFGPEERTSLARLAESVESARYAQPGTLVARDAAALRADVDAVTAAVAASSAVPDARRRRVRWFPRTGWQSLARTVGLADGAGVSAPSVSARGVRPSTTASSTAPATPSTVPRPSSGDVVGSGRR